MATKQVRIEDITVDLAIHFRDKVDQGAVARYRECLDNLPPIKLVQVEDQLLLASGLHRYYAHLDAGRGGIEAETLEGTRNDAIVLGLKDNSLHGVPLTREERNRAILQVIPEITAVFPFYPYGCLIISEIIVFVWFSPNLERQCQHESYEFPTNRDCIAHG